MSHTVVYMTDLHGNRDALEKGLALAEEVGAKSIIIGGDIFPKTVAIVLQEKEPDEKSDDDEKDDDRDDTEVVAGGEVIPVHLLTDDDLTKTCYTAMQAIQKVNTMHPEPGSLARRLEREGTILWHCTSAFYEMESLMGGERVLDLLCTAFESTVIGASDSIRAAAFTEFEREYILPEVAVILRNHVESNLTADARLAFVRQTAYIFNKDPKTVEEHDFNHVAPSRYFDTFVKFVCQPEVWAQLERLSMSLLASLESLRGDGGAGYEFLKERIEAARTFVNDAMRVMGHCPAAFFRLAAQHTDLRTLVAQATTMEVMREGQHRFFTEYLVPLLREFRAKHPDVALYLMLGNDDFIDLEHEVKDTAADGLFRYMHNNIHSFGDGWEVAGYAFVRPSPYDYKAWERPERALLTDLKDLRGRVHDPSRTIWVIHNPPWKSRLDLVQRKSDTKSRHVGSGAVRLFLKRGMGGSVALFGHIHESPHVAGGTYTEVIGGTLCVNPGAEHTAHGLHAVVFDLENVAETMRHTVFRSS